MSITIAALVAMGLSAIGDYVQQNPHMVNGLLKQSKPALNELGKKADEVVDEVCHGYEKDGWKKE